MTVQTTIVAMALLVPWTACEKTDRLYCMKNPQDQPYCAGMDADALDIPDAPTCDGGNGIQVGTGAYTVCLSPPPTAPVMISGNFNTGATSMCLGVLPSGWTANGQPDACIVVGTTITVDGINAKGPRPLVLIATNSIVASTTVSVASSRMTANVPGAGGNPAICGIYVQIPEQRNTGGGGGAGGSFATSGGGGGSGDSDSATPGVVLATAAPTVLRGGCPGQTGGDGDGVGGGGGLGGPGGGALALLAGASITLSDTIVNASGAGGLGGGHFAGGGGGGTGGMIVFDAPIIDATGAKIMANGGGGAAGSSMNQNGADGDDPNSAQPTSPAAGGPMPGGAGGDGFARGTEATIGIGGATDHGGGGGGGGAGFIQSTRALVGATAVTPAEVVP